jgi:hypothetical protein
MRASLLAILCVTPLVLGCASAPDLRVLQAPPPARLIAGVAIAVPDPDLRGWLQNNPRVAQDPAYAEWRTELDAVAWQLTAAVREQVAQRFAAAGAAAAPALLLHTEVIDFDLGRRHPLGDGDGRVAVRATLLDAANRQVLGVAEVRGRAAHDVHDAARACARGVARFLVDGGAPLPARP